MPADRAKKVGFPGDVTENICIVPLSSRDPAADAVRGWSKSNSHAANMTTKSHRLIGVGVAKGPKGYYFTQLFSGSLEPRPKNQKKEKVELGMVFNTKNRKKLKAVKVDTDLPYNSEDKELAEILLDSWNRSDFPLDQRYDYRNVRAFLYLVENHDDTLVVVKSLRALGGLYSYNPESSASYTKPGVGTVYYRRLQIDKNIKRVVKNAMKSPDKGIRNTAYGVFSSSYSKENVDSDQEQTLLRRYRSETGNPRENALHAICRIKQESKVRDDLVLEVMRGGDTKAIHDVLLFFPRDAKISPQGQKALVRGGYGLTNHPVGGIRIAALGFMGKVVRTRTERNNFFKKLDRALFDASPGVRDRAAFLVRYHNSPGSIAHLVRLARDMGNSKLFERPDGVRVSNVGLERVGDQALRSLHELSRKLPGVEPFDYALQNAKSGTPTAAQLQTMSSEAKRAKAWYESQKHRLPTQF